jgi:hypothetical protein
MVGVGRREHALLRKRRLHHVTWTQVLRRDNLSEQFEKRVVPNGEAHQGLVKYWRSIHISQSIKRRSCHKVAYRCNQQGLQFVHFSDDLDA